MARLRFTDAARADLAGIFALSLERWGEAAARRYAALLAAAARAATSNPRTPLARERAELAKGLRSFHVRHVKLAFGVKAPVHVVFYRHVGAVVEIVRVLHERMNPSEHLDP